MDPIRQEGLFGCGVACVAFILGISYQNSLDLFKNGERKATDAGFFCKELVAVLEKRGLKYKYKYINNNIRKKIYIPATIVFLRRSKKYPAGHYLCRLDKRWMDPWINFPAEEIKSGFRRRLPEKPIYLIYPIS